MMPKMKNMGNNTPYRAKPLANPMGHSATPEYDSYACMNKKTRAPHKPKVLKAKSEMMMGPYGGKKPGG